MSTACFASIGSAVRIICSARFLPISRGSRWVPPNGGGNPSRISGFAKRARSLASASGAASEISEPAPKAMPLERENSDAVLHLSQEGRHAGELPAVRGRGHPHARSSSLHGCRTGNGGHFKNAGLARVFREGAALLAARTST